MSTREYKEMRVLCLGAVILTGNKKGIEFVVLDDDNNETSKRYCFKHSANVNKNPGTIYTTMGDDDGISGGLEYHSNLDNDKRQVEIWASHEANRTALNVVAQENREAKENKDSVLDSLKVLRKAYNSTNHDGKVALIARVISYMQRSL